ncbi:hypothetical protein MKW98_012540 [Papaver atlanticum]|uniref:Uncharacterized protein n=1 Tax=Papaver atlanticum TaxID=357466 RepID=A0AAD4T254_9MAGN|nr:hypothetical protein MKW98_012540 [Papaver atlanticum]
MNKKKIRKLDDQHVVCMIGLYLCCVLFFGDINATAVNVKFLPIVETYETLLEVVSTVKACVPYLLILFAEYTPTGLIPKVQNSEQKIPRVGRWDVQVISDFIAGANMTEFSPTASFVEEFSQLEKHIGIATVEPSKDQLQRLLREQTIDNGKLKEQLQAKQEMFDAVHKIARVGIREEDLSNTQKYEKHIVCCDIMKAMGIEPYAVTQEEFMKK